MRANGETKQRLNNEEKKAEMWKIKIVTCIVRRIDGRKTKRK